MHKIFSRVTQMKAVSVVPAGMLLRAVLVLAAIEILVLTALGLTNPLVFVRTTVTRDAVTKLPIESIGACRARDENGPSPWIFLSSIIVYHTVLLLAATWISYRTRKISTTFSEGKYVGLAVVRVLQCETRTAKAATDLAAFLRCGSRLQPWIVGIPFDAPLRRDLSVGYETPPDGLPAD